MIDLHLSAFAPRWRFLYVVRIDAYYLSYRHHALGIDKFSNFFAVKVNWNRNSYSRKTTIFKFLFK